MKIHTKQFRVKSGDRLKLKRWPTKIKPFYKSKDHYRELLTEGVEHLSALQNRLYAHHRYSLLVIFQAMDAAGKDSAIAHVMSGINPQGCQVFSFKRPSDEELAHDFLWRTTACLPRRGHIGIYNRSYYEEVLIVKVHPEILAGQSLPAETLAGKPDKDFWAGRYQSINDLEAHLHRNGTRLVKFFLHVSKDEQRKRFLARIDDPAKNWKFSEQDLQERARWQDYQAAYEDCLAATSTKAAPWHIIPADDKPNARLIISHVIRDTLQQLKLEYPTVDGAQRKALQAIRKQLAK